MKDYTEASIKLAELMGWEREPSSNGMYYWYKPGGEQIVSDADGNGFLFLKDQCPFQPFIDRDDCAALEAWLFQTRRVELAIKRIDESESETEFWRDEKRRGAGYAPGLNDTLATALAACEVLGVEV